MKLHRICYLVIAIFLSACQAHLSSEDNDVAVDSIQHLPALQGDYFEFQSEVLERPLHIYVRLPQGYDDNSTDYPIVYLLDGDSLFPILASNHLFLTYDDKLPEAIIVGIAYGSFDPAINKRGYDFTPNSPDAKEGEGGAANFHHFLQNELIPDVESRFRADPTKRVLFGQSYGGTMVLYSAFTEPDLFWGRIASNPHFNAGRDLFFSAGEPASRTDLGLVVTSGSIDRQNLRQSAFEWLDYVEAQKSLPWAVKVISIEGGTHAANSTDSYREGMNWLFKSYR
ncbi:alpha/beta hydrolase [Kangiella sp.]|uniref:alpha/beta hydrolase n=1 Tax=Kangiella sp. TaxID=1920245 RepID=UPI003A8E1541